MRRLTIVTVVLLAIACGSDPPSGPVDAGADSDADSSPDVSESVRTMVERPPLDGLETRNRFFEPRLVNADFAQQPASWGPIVVERLSIRRWISPELPRPMRPAFILSANDGYVAIRGNLGDGEKVVDVWVGTDASSSHSPVPPMLIGMSIGGRTPAAVELVPSGASLVLGDVRWQRFAASMSACNGPAYLFHEASEEGDTWVHAPRLLDAADADRELFPSATVRAPTDRELLN